MSVPVPSTRERRRLLAFPGRGVGVEPGEGAERQPGPPGARCPNCGSARLHVVARIAAHRLTDDGPDRPYAGMLTLECECGATFGWQVASSASQSQG